MTTEKVFGETEWVSCWRLSWSPSPQELLEVVDLLIDHIGMTPEGKEDVRHYPNTDGKGGTGCQIYRALTESYVIAGTWPDLGITRILISSCKPYSRRSVSTFLKKQTEAVVEKGGYYEF